MAELYWRASTLTKDGEQHDLFMPITETRVGDIDSDFAKKNKAKFISI